MENHEKDNPEKKDKSDPRINYRDDWAEIHGSRKEAANEKSNQAIGEKIERIRDADGGKIKNLQDHLLEGKERDGKPFSDQVGKKEPIRSRSGIKDAHLKSSTALTHPEEAKQNLKGADKARNIGKPTTPSRGGSFRGGGAPQIDEPDEILKKKGKSLNPEDILSMQKGEKPFEVAMNEEKNDAVNLEDLLSKNQDGKQQKQESQQQQSKHQPNIADLLKKSTPKNILDEIPKDLLQSEKGMTTLKSANSVQLENKKKNAEPAITKEKNLQIAQNKVKTPSPKEIKR